MEIKDNNYSNTDDANMRKYYSYIVSKIVRENNLGIKEIVRIEPLATFRYDIEVMNKIVDALNSF